MNFILLLSLLALASTAYAAGIKAACCGEDIATPSLRKFFKPSIKSCPTKTTFVCSGSTVKILFENAQKVIRNPAAELTCRKDGKWTSSDGQAVKTISC